MALFVAYWFQLEEPYWAGTSACIVAQPVLGASLRKGRFRAIGTIVGGIIIVLITAAFPQDHSGLLLSLTLWAVICAALATLLRNFAGYAAALAGYTAVLVFAGSIETPQHVFIVAVWRVTEISIGIFCAVLVHSLTDFGDARVRLARELSSLGAAIASGVVETLQAGQEDRQMRAARRALIGRVIALDATIDEALGEPSHLRHCSAELRAVLESLFLALSAWRGIANRLGIMHEPCRAQSVSTLLPSMSALAERVWLSDPATIRELCATGRQRAKEAATSDISSRVLVDQWERILSAFETVADGLRLIATPGTVVSIPSRARGYVPDPLPAMLDALRTAAALVAAETFWVVTSWPHGPTMVVFTAVGITLFARQADAAYSGALEFASGCALAAILAAVLLLAILPAMHSSGFVELSLTLALVMLPLGTLAAGSWHKALFVAAATNLIPVLAIENQTSYDATRLFNVGLAVVIGAAVPALFFQILPALSPKQRTQRLLMLTLRDLRRLLRGDRQFSQDAWLGLISRRLAAMPNLATLEQEAELLALLSVGQSSIALLATEPIFPEHDILAHALACLAESDIGAARGGLGQFTRAQNSRPAAAGQPIMESAVQATLIADVLQRHAAFFSGAGERA